MFEAAYKYVEECRRMSPAQKNQELKSLHQMLPSSDSVWNSNQEIPDFRDEEFDPFLDKLTERKEKRLNSSLHQITTTKLSILLTFTHSTSSCTQSLMASYEMGFELGIVTNPTFGGKSELEDLGEILKWDDPNSGGLFDKNQAQMIERGLYKKQYQLQLWGLRISDTMEKYFSESFGGIDTLRRAEDIWEKQELEKMFMTEDELAELRKREESSNKFIEDFEAKIEREKSRVRRWRVDYMRLYKDEP